MKSSNLPWREKPKPGPCWGRASEKNGPPFRLEPLMVRKNQLAAVPVRGHGHRHHRPVTLRLVTLRLVGRIISRVIAGLLHHGHIPRHRCLTNHGRGRRGSPIRTGTGTRRQCRAALRHRGWRTRRLPAIGIAATGPRYPWSTTGRRAGVAARDRAAAVAADSATATRRESIVRPAANASATFATMPATEPRLDRWHTGGKGDQTDHDCFYSHGDDRSLKV